MKVIPIAISSQETVQIGVERKLDELKIRKKIPDHPYNSVDKID